MWMQGRSGDWLLFVLLVAVGASRWIVVGARPEAESTMSSLMMGCGWAALLSLMLLVRGPAKATLRKSWLGLLSGALLFAGPAVGVLLHANELDATSLTMALALTPVAVGIAAAALGAGSLDGAAGRIWPGLAAVGGLLLLLAEPSLRNVRSDVALLLAPAMTGLGAALLCSEKTFVPWRAVTALIGGTAVFAPALLATSLHTHARPTVSLLAMAYDGVMALLSVYALLRVGATRWSAQFTLLPLLIVLEGIAIVRPKVSANWVVGVALLVVSSLYLLLPAAEDTDGTMGLG
jgi:drug/metabolite transporter (DMT)-like permease